MATYRCTKCGNERSETPFCHVPMVDVESAEVKRLRNLMRAFGAADLAYDGIDHPKPGQDLLESYYALRNECRKIAEAGDGKP